MWWVVVTGFEVEVEVEDGAIHVMYNRNMECVTCLFCFV